MVQIVKRQSTCNGVRRFRDRKPTPGVQAPQGCLVLCKGWDRCMEQCPKPTPLIHTPLPPSLLGQQHGMHNGRKREPRKRWVNGGPRGGGASGERLRSPPRDRLPAPHHCLLAASLRCSAGEQLGRPPGCMRRYCTRKSDRLARDDGPNTSMHALQTTRKQRAKHSRSKHSSATWGSAGVFS